MNKKIELNGEFTKEELEEKIKEFDKPVWKVEKAKRYITLFKDNKYKCSLLFEENEHPMVNLSTISREMAGAMGDLMETKDILNPYKGGYCVYYNSHGKRWYTSSSHDDIAQTKHFNTEEIAELAAEILNKSKDMQDWIKRMSE